MEVSRKEIDNGSLSTNGLVEARPSKIVARKKLRKSGIELLRIIAMLFIVLHHFAVHTKWGWSDSLTSHRYLVMIMSAFGKTSVAIFFMITGYFLQKQKEDRGISKKIFAIVRPVWFYSIVITVVFIITGLGAIKFTGLPISKELASAIFPIVSNAPWWFAVEYVVLVLFSPILKKMLDSLRDRAILKLIILCYLVGFGAFMFNVVIKNNTGDTLIAMPSCFVLATCGYYLSRIENKASFLKNKNKVIYAGLLSVAVFLVAPIIARLMYKAGWSNMDAGFFWSDSSPITAILAFCLITLFKDLKIKSVAINYVASLTFGVYLIHDHPLVRLYLWRSFLGKSSLLLVKQYGVVFVVYAVLVVFAIFVVCCMIEAIRKTVVWGCMRAIGFIKRRVEMRRPMLVFEQEKSRK